VAFIIIGCSDKNNKNKEKESKKLCEIGSQLLKQGRDKSDTKYFDSANAYFDKSIAIIPTAEGYSCKGYYFLHIGDFDEALAFTNKASLLDSNYYKIYMVKGMIARLQKDVRLSLSYFQKELELAPDNTIKASALTSISGVYNILNEDDKALEYAERAYELDSSDITLNLLALSYTNNGYYEKSNNIYDKMLSLNLGKGSDALTWMNKGINFHKLGIYTAAISCSRKALELNPNDKRPLTNIGINYARLKEYDSAFVYINKAIELDNTMTEIYISAAELYKNMGDDSDLKKKYYPLSILEYEKAIKFDRSGIWKEKVDVEIAKLKQEME
jgi:tetratricopeptide (TPR) repeat protein